MVVKTLTSIERAARAKLRAEEGAVAMSEYLAGVRRTRNNTARLRAERLAREAFVGPRIQTAPTPAPVKVMRKAQKRAS